MVVKPHSRLGVRLLSFRDRERRRLMAESAEITGTFITESTEERRRTEKTTLPGRASRGVSVFAGYSSL